MQALRPPRPPHRRGHRGTGDADGATLPTRKGERTVTDHQKTLLTLAVQLVTDSSQAADPDKVRDNVKKNYETLRDLIKD